MGRSRKDPRLTARGFLKLHRYRGSTAHAVDIDVTAQPTQSARGLAGNILTASTQLMFLARDWPTTSQEESPVSCLFCARTDRRLSTDFNNLIMAPSDNICLWRPDSRKKTKIDDFREYVNKIYNLSLGNYHDLYQWSVDQYADFWECWWDYGNFVYSSPPTQIVDTSLDITRVPRWFTGAKLNFAENLLRFQDDRVALYATGEGQSGISNITYKQLYNRVGAYARALRDCGVSSGDRVVGYLPNCPQTIEAMLGTAALGATWSSTSPDFGIAGVLERFSQIDPIVLFSVDAVVYNGKVHDHLTKVKKVVSGLKHLLKVIIIPFVHKKHDLDISDIPNSVFLDDFLLDFEGDEPIEFEQVPFHHPLFIMFSSGTTGVPKCMVHSVGGSLVQIAKEHVLHCDLSRNDVLTYYTTTGWMMWNWLVVGLFSGCSLFLYDGSPLLPTPSILWDLVDKIGWSED
ncbi:hypothetical protein SK128_007242 [Halocaridina rubra]|uniref:Acetoacetyl-CoA synthetase n=1 Tax=Halocaridina rubra TaxID=373956 RepID=A0AAN8XUI3_HALRR